MDAAVWRPTRRETYPVLGIESYGGEYAAAVVDLPATGPSSSPSQSRTSGSVRNAAMYAITGLAADARNVQVDRSGSSAHIVAVLSYTGVSTITGGALGSGSGSTPSSTPSASGHLAVAGFDIGVSSGDVGSVVSNGNLCQLYRRTAANALAVADKDTTPVTITNPTGGSWTSIGVWLST